LNMAKAAPCGSAITENAAHVFTNLVTVGWHIELAAARVWFAVVGGLVGVAIGNGEVRPAKMSGMPGGVGSSGGGNAGNAAGMPHDEFDPPFAPMCHTS